MDTDNEVVKLLLRVGKKINKNYEQIKPFIKIIVEDNWLDSIESLKKIDDNEWQKLKLPLRLLNEIKRELAESRGVDETKNDKVLNENNNLGKCKKNNIMGSIVMEENEEHRDNLTKKFKKGISNMCENEYIGNSNNANKNNTMQSSLEKERKKDTPSHTLSINNHIERENSGKEMNPIVKCDKEKLENLIKNNVIDIQKDKIFYFSYVNGNYMRYSYSEEKNRTINSINYIEKLKNIDKNDLKSIVPILCKIVKNILINPNILNTRILKSTNDVMKNKILKYDEAKQFLLSIGFVEIYHFYVMEYIDTLLLLCSYESLQNITKDFLKIPSPTNVPFNPFKATITSIDTLKNKIKGDEQIDKLLKEKKEHIEKLINQEVDLNPKIYFFQKTNNAIKSKNDILSNSDKDDKEEEGGDIACLISNIKNLNKEQTFKSRTKLELEKINSRKIYSKTVLKILFPDSYILELSFSSGTLIKQVNEIIKTFLNKSIASGEWYIYETPGICKFDMKKKLSDYNLFPCTIVRFKADDKNNIDGNNSFLSEESIEKYFLK
ncbi:conserved Plasmodium protein, unknown function [Plasmodium berghei]|uniref:PUB domain-containing protein, putative n=2 Tax=Plasmodium berghei TaxID=5821 RepID=A0A509ATE5_PLABA|nr:PUB domain-containing protein, putative [Plasmodium berghei ANKA]CXJ10288.1 conserved Plasmodium protein, unknown function [Plasmodium berghei]SCM25945.1 conserved Plasmodium protein, unknown function [Plasmodium berghei]SCN28195.1 conserved Plasmodium protein, unknown function [Plasmodium berghei]SCO62397.1 conserved Plasmodium protein, unknown function [Plasmodium berghei]SCO63955.1 conserved Plasmodium protein, unknown function [Plasmodium berghei]|eukprot:XP_034423851.1 PUB domain-containing protein, putative [Plasmodium berghei ANKA]